MAVSQTTDCAQTWSRYYLTDTTGIVLALAVSFSNSDVVYAGGWVCDTTGQQPALFKTTDAGSGWTDVSAGLSGRVYDIAVHPDDTDIVYAGTDDGVYKSTNGGSTWTHVGLVQVNDLLIDPGTPATIIAATEIGIYLSTNEGADWQTLNNGLDTTAVRCLGIYPGAYLYAGTYGAGMYRMEWITGTLEQRDVGAQNDILFAQPNPFTKLTNISFSLAHSAQSIELRIFDATGRLVRSFDPLPYAPSPMHITWDGTDERNEKCSAGIYFCYLTVDGRDVSHKLIRLR